MPRSTALTALQRLAQVHALAHREGVTPARVREHLDEAMPRDAFLRSAAAAAAGALLGPALSHGTSWARGRERIAIIGAGMAGLTTALQLHDAGIASTVFESSNRIGGRMHSERGYWDDGQHTEWCGAMIDSKHATMRALAHRFGLPLSDTFAAIPNGARDTAFLRGKYYPMPEADRDFAQIYMTLRRQLLEMGEVTAYNSATPTARKLDAMSMAAWIERYVPGGAKSNLGALITDAYRNEYGREPEEQTSLNLVYMLGIQDGYTSDGGKINVLGYSDQRYFIANGNQRLPIAIAAALPKGSVKLGYRMTSIRKLSNGSYLLSFTTPHGPVKEQFDRVVLAIPFIVLRGLDYSGAGFDARKDRAISQLGYGIHTKLHMQFKRRPWQSRGPWPSPTTGQIWTDLRFQNSIDFTLGQPGPCGIIERFTASTPALLDMPMQPYAKIGESPAVERHAHEFLAQLDEIWPGVSRDWNGKATMSNAQVDPNLLATYSCWLVGQCTTIAGYEHVRQGRVHFAGEHTSVDYQGFMEGAASSGVAAAHEILADYNIRTRAVS
ncbi:MAG: flavin monoamine oxidase family protein [Vulcanimicrobiaceae bacterium]